MSEKTLIMCVGLPRSGKSTWARKQGYPIVNPDAIRLALTGMPFVLSAEPVVWATAKLMVPALFEAGHDRVILDACNVTQRRRDEWVDPLGRWDRFYQVFDTPMLTCLDRAVRSDRQDLIPVIRRMTADFEIPDLSRQYPPVWPGNEERREE